VSSRFSRSRAGCTIPLTAKEYGLLEFLARNAGRVLGRAEISEHVWNENFDPFSNVIEVYINRLRAKVDSGHSHQLLKTIFNEKRMQSLATSCQRANAIWIELLFSAICGVPSASWPRDSHYYGKTYLGSFRHPTFTREVLNHTLRKVQV
jgi:hypothetical protein